MTRIIDADSHFIEPLDLWQSYIEPRFRDRAMHLTRGEEDRLYFAADGRLQPFPAEDVLATLIAYGQKEEGVGLGTFDISEVFDGDLARTPDRMAFLDREGFDAQFLYPSLGLMIDALVTDPALAAAHCRAYNRWTFDACAGHRDRLYPVGHVSLRDPAAAVAELEWLASEGSRGFFIGAMPIEGKSFGHPEFDPVWAAAQDTDLAVNLHLVVHPRYLGNEWRRDPPADFMFASMNLIQDARMALTTMVYDGVFERFPGLRVAVVESSSGWVAEWIDRLDYRFSYMGHTTRMKRPASEYFASNVWVSADPDERALPHMVELVGDDKFFIGSDYPHAEGFVDPVGKAREALARLPGASVDRILGENAAAFFRI